MARSKIRAIISWVIDDLEGGFIDHTLKGDRGLATFAGISSRTFPQDYNRIVRLSRRDQPSAVVDFYMREFIDENSKALVEIDEGLGAIYIAGAIHGVGETHYTYVIQALINVMAGFGIADPVKVDGVMGPKTLAELRKVYGSGYLKWLKAALYAQGNVLARARADSVGAPNLRKGIHARVYKELSRLT